MFVSDPKRPLRADARPVRRSVRYKRTLLVFLASALLFSSIVMLTAFIVDPLQHYRKPTLYSPIYTTEQRYQNPGLARNYDYDTIIIGTSMTENFVPSEVDKALGGKTLKLSMRGSLAFEQYEIARLALSTGKVKQVLWGLDYFALKSTQDNQGPFPYYLYDNNFWNDYKYWFNESTYEQAIKGLYKQIKTGHKQSLEYLYNWDWSSTFGKELVLKHYRKAQVQEVGFGSKEDSLESVKASFERYIVPLLENNPGVEFKFYYPPYSILRQVVWQQTNPERYENQMAMKPWMFEKFNAYPNVRVYDFQAEAEWTYNLDLYKDMSHHKQEVNTWIAQAIGRDDAKYRVTPDNVNDAVSQLRRQVDETVVGPDDQLHRFRVSLPGAGDAESKTAPFTRKEMPGNGELLVPAKELAAYLGAVLEWDQATKTLRFKRGDNSLEMTAGGTGALLNGTARQAPYAPVLASGTTLTPLRFTAEALGLQSEMRELGERMHEIVIKP